MLETGTITGREIARNKDAERVTLLLQVTVSGPDDVQTCELQSFAGEDYQPPDGARVFVADVSSTYRVVVAVDDGIDPDPTIEQGERELYSSAAGERKARVRLLKDGTIRVNEGNGTAVEFARMKQAFDDLVSQVNSFITGTFNTHTHAVAGKTANATLPPAAAITADMSGAESGTVVIP